MSKTHDATQIRLKDLTALKQQAEAFLLPETGKKSLHGVGNTYSPFKSRGLDFQEVRIYQPGDDIRQIDWHVTAKYGKPFTKLYTEEKERTIFFVVDLRSNMQFATHGDFKNVAAARMTAFMAFIAEHQKDKIGYILMTDTGLYSSGDSDKTTLTPLLNSMATPPKTKAPEATWHQMIRFLNQLLPNGSFCFMFSDFYDWTDEDTVHLAPLSEKNTFLFCALYDKLESQLPEDSLPFSDGKDTLIIPAQYAKVRNAFHQEWTEQIDRLQSAAHKYAWGFLSIPTNTDYLDELMHFCFGRGRHET